MNDPEKLNEDERKKVTDGDDTPEQDPTGGRHYVCPLCHWRFFNSIMLSAHMRKSHPNAKTNPEEIDP